MRSGGAGPENGNPGGAQIVGQPRDQRRFGADYDQADVLFFAKGDDRNMVGNVERHYIGRLRDARIAGCRV